MKNWNRIKINLNPILFEQNVFHHGLTIFSLMFNNNCVVSSIQIQDLRKFFETNHSIAILVCQDNHVHQFFLCKRLARVEHDLAKIIDWNTVIAVFIDSFEACKKFVEIANTFISRFLLRLSFHHLHKLLEVVACLRTFAHIYKVQVEHPQCRVQLVRIYCPVYIAIERHEGFLELIEHLLSFLFVAHIILFVFVLRMKYFIYDNSIK